jgi:phosphopentomutase
MPRASIIVLDSVGIGGAPDAAWFGDEGANTIGHIAAWCVGHSSIVTDRTTRARPWPLHLPNLVALGLGEACRIAAGRVPDGLEHDTAPTGLFGSACEVSVGKDTPSGHWELAGVPVLQAWHHFPESAPCFPQDIVATLCAKAGLPGILGDRHASGTDIIAELGAEHIATGKPICYTSADSVFQIAAHEDHFGLERLYEVCRTAKELTRPMNVARVIARPFIGQEAAGFVRTANRRDYSEPPPAPTLLDIATSAGREVISIGKTADIFANAGTGRSVRAKSIDGVLDALLQELPLLRDGGLLFANLVDFDSEYGHRRDVAGYARALERFDERLPDICAAMHPGDLAVITADHGCDPTWRGTDHTREQVPVLAFGPGIGAGPIGRRSTFADVGASIADHLGLAPTETGASFLRGRSTGRREQSALADAHRDTQAGA